MRVVINSLYSLDSYVNVVIYMLHVILIRADCSGRSIAGVHEQAYDETFQISQQADEEVEESPLKKSRN